MSALPMSEAAWQSRITDYCDLIGLRWHHETDSRRSKAGFPDLVIVGLRGVIFAELKKDGEHPTPEQRAWLEALRLAGQTSACWRPEDWPAVQADLNWLAGRGKR